MKLRISLVLIIFLEVLFCDFQNPSIYDGVYRYGDPSGDKPNGQIVIFTESDSSLLFYIFISRGAPSFNMGTLYGRVIIKDGKGVFSYDEFEYKGQACKFAITISKDTLSIATIGKNYECGFGGNVFADGIYKKVKNLKQDFFIDPHGGKYYFKETKPEQYDEILK